MKKIYVWGCFALLSAALTACVGVVEYDGDAFMGGGSPIGAGNGDSTQYQPGVLTAGEWNDLDSWDFWCDLIQTQDDSADMQYYEYLAYWGYQTRGRVAVQLLQNELPVINANVELKAGDASLWKCKTDNRGRAELWADLTQVSLQHSADQLQLYVEGNRQDVVLKFNELNVLHCAGLQLPASHLVQLAFVVDATGSMVDEMEFLKQDLMNVLSQVKSKNEQIELSTAALFYRDEGDEYVTKHSDFTDKLMNTVNYIKKQSANGGGDYPEAVHTALNNTLQLRWEASARTRLAFLLLDAPAHYHDEVLKSLHQSVFSFASQGIKLIPVAASGVNKHTEFMLRYFAMATGGTYVFLTDDSGVGSSHIKPSVGEYQVQSLNSLMQEIILRYAE